MGTPFLSSATTFANVNTTGFKESRGNFSDILSQSSGHRRHVADRPWRVGLQRVTGVHPGAFQSTLLPGDLAIDGNGFFIVKDPKTNALPVYA